MSYRRTYVVRLVVDQEFPESLTENDFTLRYAHPTTNLTAVSVDQVRKWEPEPQANDDVANICEQCFGDIRRPSYDGPPENGKDCHRAFPMPIEQGILI